MKYAAVLCLTLLAGCSKDAETKSASTRTLEVGSAMLQNHAPVNALDVYLVGFHPMKADPSHQMEAHHYCRQNTEDVAQCVLFDGNSTDARMNGTEYIISSRIYQGLPAEEKQFWHPHNYEILSGQLVAPGIPGNVEKELMRKKMNSWGKTFHFMWGDAPVPIGEPKLAWSFTKDGQIRQELLTSRDQRLKIDSAEKRRERQDLSALAQSQD